MQICIHLPLSPRSTLGYFVTSLSSALGCWLVVSAITSAVIAEGTETTRAKLSSEGLEPAVRSKRMKLER